MTPEIRTYITRKIILILVGIFTIAFLYILFYIFNIRQNIIKNQKVDTATVIISEEENVKNVLTELKNLSSTTPALTEKEVKNKLQELRSLSSTTKQQTSSSTEEILKELRALKPTTK